MQGLNVSESARTNSKTVLKIIEIQSLFQCHTTVEFDKAFRKLGKPAQKIVNQIIQEVVEELSCTSNRDLEYLSVKREPGRR